MINYCILLLDNTYKSLLHTANNTQQLVLLLLGTPQLPQHLFTTLLYSLHLLHNPRTQLLGCLQCKSIWQTILAMSMSTDISQSHYTL